MVRLQTKAASRSGSQKGGGRAGAISGEQRRRMIAEAAYYRAERRGFAGADPVADWLTAEAEIDRQLAEHR